MAPPPGGMATVPGDIDRQAGGEELNSRRSRWCRRRTPPLSTTDPSTRMRAWISASDVSNVVLCTRTEFAADKVESLNTSVATAEGEPGRIVGLVIVRPLAVARPVH